MLSHSKTMSYIGYIRNELRHRGFDDTGSLNSVLDVVDLIIRQQAEIRKLAANSELSVAALKEGSEVE